MTKAERAVLCDIARIVLVFGELHFMVCGTACSRYRGTHYGLHRCIHGRRIHLA